MTVIDTEARPDEPLNEEVQTEPKFDKLGNREALEKALSVERESEPEKKESVAEPARKEPEVKAAPEIEPPSEFSSEGKRAWREKDLSGIQKEYRRLHDSRTQEITRAQTEEKKAKEEARVWRDLGKACAPYIEARGKEGVSPEKAMMEAIDLVNEFRKGDPASIKAELKKAGIDLDKASTAVGAIPPEVQERLDTLQKNQDEFIKEREARKFESLVHTFEGIFGEMGSQKTRTGDPVYPDLLDTSEKGQQFARELGSLAFSPQFQEGAKRRFPEADLKIVIREGYKYLGGKVSGEAAKVSTSNQAHIDKSRRAAAAAPGRVISRNDSSNLVGKLSNRAALVRALEESREH